MPALHKAEQGQLCLYMTEISLWVCAFSIVIVVPVYWLTAPYIEGSTCLHEHGKNIRSHYWVHTGDFDLEPY